MLANNLGKEIGLEDYTARNYPRLPGSGSESGGQSFLHQLLQQKTTSYTDAELAAKFAASACEHHIEVRLRHPRDLTVRDFYSDNWVIIGGRRKNPWAELVESTLNFRFEIDPKTGRREIVNQSPRHGEDARYFNGDGTRRGVCYARLAVVANLAHNGKIFLLGGTDTAATLAASNFMLEPASLEIIQKSLRSAGLSGLDPFELLLEVSGLDGTPRQARLVSWRSGRAHDLR
jgi:hypothetical protein